MHLQNCMKFLYLFLFNIHIYEMIFIIYNYKKYNPYKGGRSMKSFHEQPTKSIDIESVTIRDIWKARKRINPIIRKTPLLKSTALSKYSNASVYLKMENLQEIGAFKVRGAANKILSLTPEQQKRGVTTFSTGNHGLAVAYVAGQLGIKAVICISNRVPKAKIDAIKSFGAELQIYGKSQDDAEKYCYKLQEEQGLTVIKPFDDPYIIAGQGTIGLELLEDLPEIDTVVIPLSGGGLLSGIALTLKSNDSNIEVTGVSMERSAVMYESLKAGRPVVLEEHDTLADSLLGGIGLDNRYTFNLVRQYIDNTVLVSEEAIAEGMAFMLDQHRVVAEGAAATGIAAALQRTIKIPGKNIAIIVSGCNVDLSVLMEVTQKCNKI
jgi:threonine dehydratase